VSGTNRAYDSLMGDAITGTANLNGVFSGDVVNLGAGSASFGDKNVGTGKTVTFSGYTIFGTDAANYTVSQAATSTANISTALLTASLTGTVDKTYDSTTAATLTGDNYHLAGVFSGDTAFLNNPSTGTYDTPNAGS